MTPAQTDAFTQFADELADTARDIALRYFRSDPAVESKADATPVTVADREIESTLRRRILREFPEHGVVGEEEGAHAPDSELVWVVDPIDGTKSFVTGVPLFGCLIALLSSGVPVLGVLEAPAMKERWIGTPSRTVHGHTVVRSSECPSIEEASLFTTTPDMFDAAQLPCFEKIRERARIVRLGTDCYAYGLLASGFADLVVEADMAPYDYLALVPVVEGAGGVMTDWRGNRLDLHSDGDIVAAANSRLHSHALELLQV